MNIPLVLAALVALYLLDYTSARPHERPSLDWLGALAFAGVLALVTVLLNAFRGEASALVLGIAIAAFLVFLVLFVQRQFSATTPIAEWRLFRIRSYAGATGYILLSNLVMYTTILAVPFFVEEVQGKSSATAVTLLGAVSLPVVFIAPIGGRISDSVGRRAPVVIGSVLMVAGVTALLFGINPDVSYLFLALVLALLGVGLGLSTGPASAAAIESTPRELAGAAAGTNSMMRYVGSIIGAGVLGSVLNTNAAAPGTDLFRLIFALLVVMSVLAALCRLLVHRFPKREDQAQDESQLLDLAAAID
jgi:Na+/melibiose symporter-like transporter